VSRRITVSVRGLPVEVVYTDRGCYEPAWYFATVNWRMIDYGQFRELTRGEVRAIDAACLADLVERRQDWNRRKELRRHCAIAPTAEYRGAR
jgi:hypothetical protein